MVTCPWCGTSYTAFQSSCDKCGGPLPPPAQTSAPTADARDMRLSKPPSAPRPISDRYAWRLMFTDGWGVVALVFTILGAVFTLVGGGLTLGIITAFVGLPFLVMGLVFLVSGLAIAQWRYRLARQTVEVLKIGDAVEGQIVSVEQNFNVRINQRHPWTIRYQFQALGQPYTGQVSTLNVPGPTLQPGQRAWVLYLPNTPERNALYPHP
jgi:hypothetical protein